MWGGFVNVGSGEDMKISEMVRLVREAVGFSEKLEHDRTKPDGMPQKVLDVSSMLRFSWSLALSLHEGIKKHTSGTRKLSRTSVCTKVFNRFRFIGHSTFFRKIGRAHV